MQKVPKYIIATAATIAGVLLLWYFRTIVVYILIAAVLGIIGGPLVTLIKKIHIKDFRFPGWLAALLTLIVIAGVAVGFFSLFIPLIFNKLSQLANLDIPGMLASLDKPIAAIEQFLHEYFAVDTDNFSISGALATYISDNVSWSTLNSALSSIISIGLNTLIALFAILFMTFFFLKDEGLFLRILLAVTPTRYEENIKHALGSITKLLSRYLVGIICESTVMMLLVSTGLMIWGYPASDAFFMGIIVGILNVIPYVGPWLGFAICFLIGIAIPPAGMSLLVIFLSIGSSVLIAQGIDNFLLQPVIYSNSVKAHPLEIFIVLLMAGKVGGVVGMVLAIPTYTILRVIAKEFFYNFKIVRKLTENMNT